jgi:hypothetical protein
MLELTEIFLVYYSQRRLCMTGEPGSSPSKTTSAAGCSHDWAAHGPAPRGRMGPRVEHQPCPVSSAGQQATTATTTSAAGVLPHRSAGDTFRTSIVYLGLFLSTLGIWRQGFGEYVFSSPVSFLNSGTPRSTRGGSGWRIEREVQRAYIIINSL